MQNLVYVSDQEPGIQRIARSGASADTPIFDYQLPDGKLVTDEAELERIKTLGLPPAYKDVWICMDRLGHIQATGIDDASRKQYRYHDYWTQYRNNQKFERLAEFADVLPRIRRKVSALLSPSGPGDDAHNLGKEVAAAGLVRLLDRTAMRVGGRSKQSRGATTLVASNIDLSGESLRLRYKAKGGKRVQRSLRDNALQRTLEQIDDLPGRRLFQYIGMDGEVHPLNSEDVNQWLKDCSGTDFVSAKIFRTWHGSVTALDAIMKSPQPTIKVACEAAAQRLKNTASICRKSYVHPDVITLASDSGGEAIEALKSQKIRGFKQLRKPERIFANLITK